jgi:hypothetical protein
MSITPKTNSIQTYTSLLYRKAIHPEFFGIEGRNRIEHCGMEVEGWVFKGGHCARFAFGSTVLVEAVVENPQTMPERGLRASLLCNGERDHEERLSDHAMFMTTIQTETLSEHLYLGTYKEMVAHARENDSLFAAWTDAAGKPNLSLIDVQHFRNEVHVQGYHLRSDCGLVLRTQSMLQVVTPKKGAAKDARKGAGKAGDSARDSSSKRR